MSPFPTRAAAEAYLGRIADPVKREATRQKLGLGESAGSAPKGVRPAPPPAPSAAPGVDVSRDILRPPRPLPALAGALTLDLPWPPSLNSIWRAVVITGRSGKPRARVLLSQKGRAYRKAVMGIIAGLGSPATPPMARLRVHLLACPPDRRRRDLSNIPKILEDSLTHAQVWADDSLIDDLHVTRGEITPGGAVLVTITPLSNTLFGGLE